MGFNTAVIICNDQLEELSKSPHAGRVIKDAIDGANYRRLDEERNKAAYGAFSVGALPSRHADDGQLVLISQNSIQLVGLCWSGDPLEALKQVADQLGYALHKKPERKTT